MLSHSDHEADADDGASSFGDDESEHSLPKADMEDEDLQSWLPEAFAGQDIEDLAYGGGASAIRIPQEYIGGWLDHEDEEEDEIEVSRLTDAGESYP